ncbi:hypothetical protein BDN71DRAFT_417659 [Pleurotus eryngii]|uniref:Uncharacterized protein n=1 Tax=Pleurotus eryngii TaxID=5323 RepID=A0A9P6DB78_PLEER|nr:hypothetical protein BDN71DRAFT_417659 [Pleurotus eryngii]
MPCRNKPSVGRMTNDACSLELVHADPVVMEEVGDHVGEAVDARAELEGPVGMHRGFFAATQPARHGRAEAMAKPQEKKLQPLEANASNATGPTTWDQYTLPNEVIDTLHSSLMATSSSWDKPTWRALFPGSTARTLAAKVEMAKKTVEKRMVEMIDEAVLLETLVRNEVSEDDFLGWLARAFICFLGGHPAS